MIVHIITKRVYWWRRREYKELTKHGNKHTGELFDGLVGCSCGFGERRVVPQVPLSKAVLGVLATFLRRSSRADGGARNTLATARPRGRVRRRGGFLALIEGRGTIDTHGDGGISKTLIETTSFVVPWHVLDIAQPGRVSRK